MDYEQVTTVEAIAMRHAREGTDVARAWHDIVNAASDELGDALSREARTLAPMVVEGVKELTGDIVELCKATPPGPQRKGLYLGLVEYANPDDEGASEWVVSVIGTDEFDLDDEDWASEPTWEPEDGILSCDAMQTMSEWRDEHEDAATAIEMLLINPLVMLVLGQIAHHAPKATLVGKAKSIGLASGFADGDLHVLGVVTPAGFESVSEGDDDSGEDEGEAEGEDEQA